jgi:hypothetical protein
MTYGYAATETDPNRRPGTVTTACILTWVFASLAIASAGAMLVAVTAGRDEFVDSWEKESDLAALDVDAETAADVIVVLMAVCLVLAALAIVVAVAAFRRSSAGRVGLMVLSGLTAVVSLLLSVAIVPFLWVIASTVTLILLFTGSVNQWYTRRPASVSQPAYLPPQA